MKIKVLGVILVTSILALSWVEMAFAGAWTVPKNRGWSEYYMKWDYGKEEFTAEGKRKQLGRGKDARSWEFVMEPKLEYGITDWLNFQFGMEYYNHITDSLLVTPILFCYNSLNK